MRHFNAVVNLFRRFYLNSIARVTFVVIVVVFVWLFGVGTNYCPSFRCEDFVYMGSGIILAIVVYTLSTSKHLSVNILLGGRTY